MTDEHAVIGIWGPRARDVLASATRDDVSSKALPYRRALEIDVAGARVLAQRITYVGELGYELYVAPEHAVAVWDWLWAAGARARDPRGRLPRAGVAADGEGLPLLRQRPHRRRHAGGGRRRILRRRAGRTSSAPRRCARRLRDTGLRTLVVGEGPGYLRLYGGEAVRSGGEVVGRVRSCAYAFSLGRNVALATVPVALAVGARVEVEVLGEPVTAVVAQDVLYDPAGERLVA